MAIIVDFQAYREGRAHLVKLRKNYSEIQSQIQSLDLIRDHREVVNLANTAARLRKQIGQIEGAL